MHYDEASENRKLLYKYLKKQYGEEKAKELIKQNKEHLFDYHGLAWALGKRSIEFFCLYFLQDTFVPKPNNAARQLAPVHYELWQEAEKMFLKDEYDKLELILPRGSAKTTIFDFAISVWLHSYGISPYTLVCGKTEQDAIEFIAVTKQAFTENEYIKRAFGELIDEKRFTVNKLEIELTNRTKIQAISSTSSIRGKKYGNYRPAVVIADDYQGKSDIITEEAREKKYRTWMDDAKFAGDEAVYRNGKKIKMATKFIVLGTILHRDCFMSRLMQNKEYKHILRRAVLVDDVDELFNSGLWAEFKKIYFDDSLQDPEAAAREFYFQHEDKMQFPVLWPDKWNCCDLAINYYNDSISFKQELQNDASKIGEKWFKSIRLQSPEEIEKHNFIKTMLCVDPASTAGTSSDYCAFLVGSLADNGFKYCRKAELAKINARKDFDKYLNHIIELLKDFEDITHLYIEKNTFNGADANRIENMIAADPMLSHRDIKIINEMQKKNKDDKIATIVSDVNNGAIIFNAQDKEFIEQIKEFAGQDYTLHDDAADITAEFANRIEQIEVIRPLKFFDRKLLF